VGVDVDESGAQHAVPDVDHPGGPDVGQVTDRDDPVAGHRDVRNERFGARTVDDDGAA